MLKPEQIQERFDLIGGSDLYHLFNVNPTGCVRKLWYIKKEKYIPEMTPAMERGFLLEPIVREKFQQMTGYTIINVDDETILAEKGIGGHLDGIVKKDEKDAGGILEIKVPSLWKYREIKKGAIPDNYILQVQYYMWIANKDYGILVVFNPELWEMQHYEIKRDEELIEKIKEECRYFRDHYLLGDEEPAGIYDYRCNKCPFNVKCAEGLKFEKEKDESEKISKETFSTVEKIMEELYNIKREVDILTEKEKELRRQLQETLPLNSKIKTNYGTVSKYSTVSERFDKAQFKKDFPDIYPKYTIKKENVSLRVNFNYKESEED